MERNQPEPGVRHWGNGSFPAHGFLRASLWVSCSQQRRDGMSIPCVVHSPPSITLSRVCMEQSGDIWRARWPCCNAIAAASRGCPGGPQRGGPRKEEQGRAESSMPSAEDARLVGWLTRLMGMLTGADG